MRYLRATTAAAAITAVAAFFGLTAAEAAEDFYKGKNLTVVVTSGPGGSVDLVTRLTTKHLSKYIPGNPNVIVVHKPGADGVVGVNYMYSQAVRDGTEIATTLSSVVMEPLFYGSRSVGKFNATEFNWLGSSSKFVLVSIAWNTSPIKKWDDLLEKEMIVGSGGAGSGGTIDSLIMRNLMGFKYKLVLGYPSGADTDLAMMRGEIDGRASTAWAAIQSRYPDWVPKKQVSLLFQYGLEKDPSIPAETPLIINHVPEGEKKQALKLRMAADELGYPILAPPGVPADRIEILRKAYAEVFKDPNFLADAEKARVEVLPVTGERLASLVKEAYSTPQSSRELLQQASVPPSVFDQVKTVKVSAALSKVDDKGMITFSRDGKDTTAGVVKETAVTVAGNKAEGKDLKAGMSCEIDYFGDKGQAKSVACK
jgi:tripartite-type tricarboxylate transporter receptor subunit TctC